MVLSIKGIYDIEEQPVDGFWNVKAVYPTEIVLDESEGWISCYKIILINKEGDTYPIILCRVGKMRGGERMWRVIYENRNGESSNDFINRVTLESKDRFISYLGFVANTMRQSGGVYV